MDIKDMRAFYAVAEEGNISHAAQRLDVAQPALSRQMKRLEESLGVKLFERGSRRIRLTGAGQAFVKRVEHILGLMDGAVREAQDIERGAAGSIRIGAITTSGAMILPRLMAKFHETHPKILFELWESDGGRILELLDNRVIDIAITRTRTDDASYESILLPNEPLVVIMPKDNPVGARDNAVDLKELEGHPMIIPLRWRGTFADNCRRVGFEPNIVCVSRSSALDLLFVKNGMGVALLPMSAKGLMTDDNLIAKELTAPEMTTHTVVSWLKDYPLSGGATQFLELFREMFTGYTGEGYTAPG